MNGTSIAGRKRSYTDTAGDCYETPKWATESLLDVEPFAGSILEPACGYNAIVDVLCERLPRAHITGSDIRLGKDFLEEFPRKGTYDHVITNPPYALAEDFVRKALSVSTQKVAMLLKLSFLESERRRALFSDTPLARVHVFCKRVNPYPHGTEKPKSSGTIAYAWYVWEHGHEGAPTIQWL